jgi:hypothetical protein
MKHCSINENIYIEAHTPRIPMNNVSLLSELFDKKILNVLDIFLENKTREFQLRELAKEAKVPLASTSRIVSRLTETGVVDVIQIKQFKLWKLADNDKTNKLDLIIMGRKNPIEFFTDAVKRLEGISSVILYGTPDREGGNILLIGNNIDANEVKAATAKTKERFSFTVNTLVLTEEQFDQMNRMNLYPQTKKVIYTK